MKILIIEDEYSLADAIAETLKKENFSCNIVTDGEEGENEALTDVYDLILLDIMLPSKNGFEILNNLRQENIDTPIIILTAKSEINVIGLNVDEAVLIIDKFLDDCYLAKLQTVRIVHGKGTGKLREGIHKFLKTNSHVKSFRVGTFGEGEMGVTVVELK